MKLERCWNNNRIVCKSESRLKDRTLSTWCDVNKRSVRGRCPEHLHFTECQILVILYYFYCSSHRISTVYLVNNLTCLVLHFTAKYVSNVHLQGKKSFMYQMVTPRRTELSHWSMERSGFATWFTYKNWNAKLISTRTPWLFQKGSSALPKQDLKYLYFVVYSFSNIQ